MAEENYTAAIDIAELEEEEEQPSLTYRLDLESGHISGKIDEIEAVKQAIAKAIKTPRFKCLLYDDQYGSEIAETIIARDATPEYIVTAVEGFINDALLPDTRILGDVYDVAVDLSGDTATVSFKVNTIFGETSVEEEF